MLHDRRNLTQQKQNESHSEKHRAVVEKERDGRDERFDRTVTVEEGLLPDDYGFVECESQHRHDERDDDCGNDFVEPDAEEKAEPTVCQFGEVRNKETDDQKRTERDGDGSERLRHEIDPEKPEPGGEERDERQTQKDRAEEHNPQHRRRSTKVPSQSGKMAKGECTPELCDGVEKRSGGNPDGSEGKPRSVRVLYEKRVGHGVETTVEGVKERPIIVKHPGNEPPKKDKTNRRGHRALETRGMQRDGKPAECEHERCQEIKKRVGPGQDQPSHLASETESACACGVDEVSQKLRERNGETEPVPRRRGDRSGDVWV